MYLGTTWIDDSYAEAFRMPFVRVVVTACDESWVNHAATAVVGYGTSIIGCDAEAGVEQWLSSDETPDGRPGCAVLFFARSLKALAKAVGNRVGQCILTCPTTAAFDGLPQSKERVRLGEYLRFFGDGFQKLDHFAGRPCWRIPVMDGEFLVEATVGAGYGVGGGNLIIQGIDGPSALAGASQAVAAVRELNGVIIPFPGGFGRSGSKVGSRYRGLIASTNEAFCPTLRGRVESRLHPEAQCAYEVVIDGVDEVAVTNAMRVAIRAAAREGVLQISAANFGGRLGKIHFFLRDLVG